MNPMNPKIDADAKETIIWDAALLGVVVGAACVPTVVTICVPVIVKIGVVVAT